MINTRQNDIAAVKKIGEEVGSTDTPTAMHKLSHTQQTPTHISPVNSHIQTNTAIYRPTHLMQTNTSAPANKHELTTHTTHTQTHQHTQVKAAVNKMYKEVEIDIDGIFKVFDHKRFVLLWL